MRLIFTGLAAALLLASCGRTPTPTTSSPQIQKGVENFTPLGIYEINFQDANSQKISAASKEISQAGGFHSLGLGEVKDKIGLERISVNTFTIDKNNKRYINAIFKVTNKGQKDLALPTFLPVEITSLDEAHKNSATIAGTPFRNVARFDGSAATDAASKMHLISPVSFDPSSATAVPDVRLPSFKAFRNIQIPLDERDGIRISLSGMNGWQLETPQVLKSGEAATFSFSTEIDMAADSKDDPFSFSIIAIVAQKDEEAPAIRLDQYDNAAGILSGTVTDNGYLSSVKIYDNDTLIGTAVIDGTRWSMPWVPTDTSKTLKIVATDTAGNTSETTGVFDTFDASSTTSLNHQVPSVRLPRVAGQDLRYTTDGSAVTALSPLYTHPLIFLKPPTPTLSYIPTNPQDTDKDAGFKWVTPLKQPATMNTLRYRSFNGNQPADKEQSRLYGQNPDPTLPVISLQTDAANLFDDAKGIYVPGNTYKNNPDWSWYWGTGNYHQSGSAWERPASLTVYDANGESLLAQQVGLRIHGSGSAAMPQKSLRIYASKDYDTATTLAPVILPGAGVASLKRVILHSGGQDSFGTKIQDCAYQDLLGSLNLDHQACKPYNVYIDGEYWGIQTLRERYDEYYINSHYNIATKNVTIIDGVSRSVDVGAASDLNTYTSMIDFFSTMDLSLSENYTKATSLIDIQNFTHYVIAETYINNLDWPQNNFKLWRSTIVDKNIPQSDSRWRWLFYDTDYAFVDPGIDTIERLRSGNYGGNKDLTIIFSSLSKNSEFRRNFVSSYRGAMKDALSGSRFSDSMNSYRNQISGSMQNHVDRWGRPGSLSGWGYEVNNRISYINNRPSQIENFLNSYLSY